MLSGDQLAGVPELCGRGHALCVGQDGSDRFPESVRGDPVEAGGFSGFAPLLAKPVGVPNGQGA